MILEISNQFFMGLVIGIAIVSVYNSYMETKNQIKELKERENKLKK